MDRRPARGDAREGDDRACVRAGNERCDAHALGRARRRHPRGRAGDLEGPGRGRSRGDPRRPCLLGRGSLEPRPRRGPHRPRARGGERPLAGATSAAGRRAEAQGVPRSAGDHPPRARPGSIARARDRAARRRFRRGWRLDHAHERARRALGAKLARPLRRGGDGSQTHRRGHLRHGGTDRAVDAPLRSGAGWLGPDRQRIHDRPAPIQRSHARRRECEASRFAGALWADPGGFAHASSVRDRRGAPDGGGVPARRRGSPPGPGAVRALAFRDARQRSAQRP